ncbi:MAG: hypothetical protein GX620_02165 [Chloroflexi bacterium]|nr:hypothetical protein [Chloroflexota bacterium]
MEIRSTFRSGLVSGLVGISSVILGITGLAGNLVKGWFGFSSQRPGAWVLLLLISLWAGVRVAKDRRDSRWSDVLRAAAFAGFGTGLLMGVFTLILALLVESGVDMRKSLVQLDPASIRLLTLGLSPVLAGFLMLVTLTAAAVVGGLLDHASARYRWWQWVREKPSDLGRRVLEVPPVSRFLSYKHARAILYGIAALALLVAPLFLGQYWNYTLGTVGIYVILGLGLNIVVGMAGLLNLGYVAFFAIGGYTVALLTAPEPHGLMMGFWPALVIGVILSTVSGILLCIPVLRTRGDYLAIVTLGFGEIIRILAKSDVLTEFTAGPKGVRAIGGPSIFGWNINNEFYFLYLIILSILLVAIMTHRLQHSRIGRAWMAMREDEDVAQAMGVHALKYKLLAFAIGAAFAGVGGALFASRNKFTGPEDYTLLVSINVLCLVIIGGMGSIPGVVLGALVLKGLPEVLRQLDDYRMLAFGALLIVMMIIRPQGLWPSSRTRMSSDQEESPGAVPGEIVAGGVRE